MQEMGEELKLKDRRIIEGRVLIENIILTSDRKISKGDIKYLQIHLHKVPKTKEINETSSERIKPTFTDDDEVSFQVSEDEEDTFLLHFSSELADEDIQYEVELQIKQKKVQTIGTFGICYQDLKIDALSQRMKTRQLKSQSKHFPKIEIKFKVCTIAHVYSVPRLVKPLVEPDPIPGPDTQDSVPAWHKFKRKSCIVVLGSSGRGKTTTMNLYTSNTAETGDATYSTTQMNRIYPDMNHKDYPVWLDTIGLDDADGTLKNSELARDYLIMLKDAKLKWVHALVWCIAPESKKLEYLTDQAKVIKSFGFGQNSRHIWKNVVIIAKQGSRQNSFQGALAAITEVEDGHTGLVPVAQCIQYDLDTQSHSSARSRLHQAFTNIETPIKVTFSRKVCLDCGQKGDENLISDMCHDIKEKKEWSFGLGMFCSILPPMFQCRECKGNWTRKILGRWSFTSGPPCVRVRNQKDIRGTERLSEKKGHNMVEYKWYNTWY